MPAPRAAGLSRADFAERWRQAAEFAMSLPLWRHMRSYSLCHVLDADEAGLRGTPLEAMAPEEFGGVAMAVYRSPAALREFFADPVYPQLAAEHERLFGEPAADRFSAGRYLVARRVAKIERPGPAAATLFGMLRRTAHLTREQFLVDWNAYAEAHFSPYEEITRDLVDHAEHRALVDDERAAGGFDGALEVGFPDVASIVPWFATAGGIAPPQDFYDPERSLYLLVKKTVFYDSAEPR
jgi:hypothetical protein